MASISNFDELCDRYADFFGQATALYNINPLLGRLYGYLFLSPHPLNLDDLVERAGAAKSTVSVAMKSLEHYRFVRRQWKKGDRRDYFAVRTDAAEVFRELYQVFLSRELTYVRDATEEAVDALSADGEKAGWPDVTQRRELLHRLKTLSDITSTVSTMLEQLLSEPVVEQSKSIHIEVEE